MGQETTKVLVVDDDMRLRSLLERYLVEQGFIVRSAGNAEQMDRLIERENFHLLVLDLMLPGEDGLSICRRLRQKENDIPIIMLTAKGDEVDRIIGLELGADDYIPKPFNPRELLARIKVLLRRSKSTMQAEAKFEKLYFGPVMFDTQTARLWNLENQEVPLTSTEQILLKILAQNPFNPFSRHDLCNKAGFTVGQRTIDVQVTRLRKKLNDTMKQSKYIKTIRHVGYALYPDSIQ